MEIEELIVSKCSGQEADYLFEQWRMIVQKNEQISNKRWLSNENGYRHTKKNFGKGMQIQTHFSKKEKRNQLTLKQLNHNKSNIIVIVIKTDLLMIMSKMYNIIKEIYTK